jgi:mannose-6-phosphate isomerase-like protein (cupin superfamily)
MPTEVAQFGPVVNEISGMGDTHELLGGVGRCRWKQLINGMHLNGPWNCVEYVVIPPGASCGRHTHLKTEEIYYILSGAAEMEVDGEPIDLSAGDLVTATIGTSHGTVNHTDEDMAFLVVEVFPGTNTPPSPMKVRVPDRPRVRLPATGEAEAGVEHSINLETLFAGPWRSFTTIELAPGGRLQREPLADGDEVLFVARGAARIEFGAAAVEGSRGLCVGVPPGAERAIANRSDSDSLEVLSTIVGLG